jgi:hypothetical protein
MSVAIDLTTVAGRELSRSVEPDGAKTATGTPDRRVGLKRHLLARPVAPSRVRRREDPLENPQTSSNIDVGDDCSPS